jgi:hypothetical protein
MAAIVVSKATHANLCRGTFSDRSEKHDANSHFN